MNLSGTPEKILGFCRGLAADSIILRPPQEANVLDPACRQKEKLPKIVEKEVESEVTSEAAQRCAALQEDTKPLQNSYESGTFPRSFEEAPIATRTKDFETEITPKLDAEILRLRDTGKNPMEISEELVKKNIFISRQRVKGRLIMMGRKKAKAGGETSEVQSSQVEPEVARTEELQPTESKSGIPLELGERIKKLDASNLIAAGISDQLYEDDGTVLSAGEISCYLIDIARGLKK
jgi:hypothetical protein